jgi:hypothetical protein
MQTSLGILILTLPVLSRFLCKMFIGQLLKNGRLLRTFPPGLDLHLFYLVGSHEFTQNILHYLNILPSFQLVLDMKKKSW